MDGSRDASFGLRRVEIGIVGDLVVSRVAATMALPKGLLWKHKARRKMEGKGEGGERNRERKGEKDRETKRDGDGKREVERGRTVRSGGEVPCKKTLEDKGV